VGEFTILLGSMGAASLENAWIYTAFATTGVILAAVYLLWMFQRVFLGPLDNPENEKLRDLNGRELFVMLAFLLFIVWIGIAPAGYFNLMDSTVADLVRDITSAASLVGG
jgi:NADH-quinone oxidoreductase subunit M